MTNEIVVQETKLELVNDGDTLVLESTPTVVELVIGGAPTYTVAETNDLTAAVTWDDIPDANVPESAVTQHEAALSIVAGNMDAEASTDGQVLTSDGAGNAAWEDSAGGVSDVDDLTANTGNATEMVRVDGAGTGLEYRTQAQVLSDIGAETAGAAATVQGNLDTHEGDTANPHSVTKTQVGLGSVPNLDTTDAVNNEHTHANKAQLDLVTDGDHDVRTDNPHSVTAAQVGALSSADIDTLSELNAIVTDATLDDSGDARTPTAHNHAASDVNSGTFADVRIAQSSVTQHQTALSITESQISDLTHTTSASDLTSGTLADARVAQSNVTQHQAALSITESQISDLSHFGGALNDLSDVANSTPANRHVLAYDGVTDNRYENRLLVEADISDLGSYLTAETNDLTAAVTWANVPDGNITQSSVTQHEGALTLSNLAGSVTDGQVPNTITLDNITQITARSHTNLSDIGTNTHAQIDTHILDTGTAVHGLGTISTQAANSVSITGGSITGITDLAIADGGTGASTASGARTNLGVAIGSDVQAYSTVLAATTASFTTADETKLDNIEANADVTDTTNVTAAGALMDSEVDADIKTLSLPASTTISTFGASLVDDASATAARSTLGLGSIATQAASNVSITGGSITGITGLVVGAAALQSGSLVDFISATNSLLRITSSATGIAGIDIGDSDKTDVVRMRYNNSSNAYAISTHADNASISFATNGTGDISFNTNDLFIDTSTSHVGIGTVTPTEAVIEVQTAELIIAHYETSNSTAGYFVVKTTNATAFPLVQLQNAGKSKTWNIENSRSLAGGLGFYLSGDSTKFLFDENGRAGINTGDSAPLAQIHADQASATAAIPVLYLDQADISEEMIQFETTIGTGNAIEAIGAKTLTTTHFIKVTIPGGLTRYIPVGTIA